MVPSASPDTAAAALSSPELNPSPPTCTTMPTRLASSFALPPPDDPIRPSYTTRRDDHQFAKQYANLYWLRLVVLRKRVLERARRKWEGAGKLEGQSLASLSCVSCSNFPSAPTRLQRRALFMSADEWKRVEARSLNKRLQGPRRCEWVGATCSNRLPRPSRRRRKRRAPGQASSARKKHDPSSALAAVLARATTEAAMIPTAPTEGLGADVEADSWIYRRQDSSAACQASPRGGEWETVLRRRNRLCRHAAQAECA